MTKLQIEKYKTDINKMRVMLEELKKQKRYTEATKLKYHLARHMQKCPREIHAAAFATTNYLKHTVLAYINVLVIANYAVKSKQALNATCMSKTLARLDDLFQEHCDLIMTIFPQPLMDKFVTHCEQFAKYYPHTQRIIDRIKIPLLTKPVSTEVEASASESDDEEDSENKPIVSAPVLVAKVPTSSRYSFFKTAALGAGLFYIAGSDFVVGGLAGAAVGLTVNTLTGCCKKR